MAAQNANVGTHRMAAEQFRPERFAQEFPEGPGAAAALFRGDGARRVVADALVARLAEARPVADPDQQQRRDFPRGPRRPVTLERRGEEIVPIEERQRRPGTRFGGGVGRRQENPVVGAGFGRGERERRFHGKAKVERLGSIRKDNPAEPGAAVRQSRALAFANPPRRGYSSVSVRKWQPLLRGLSAAACTTSRAVWMALRNSISGRESWQPR